MVSKATSGGRWDFWGQRSIEVWSALPFLYVVIVLGSIYGRSFLMLVIVSSIFSWIGLSYYMRGEFLKLKGQTYIAVAKSLGLPTHRIFFRHILPNGLTPVVTLVPFALIGGISALTSLDFFGFGLNPPTPSWESCSSKASTTTATLHGSPSQRSSPSSPRFCWLPLSAKECAMPLTLKVTIDERPQALLQVSNYPLELVDKTSDLDRRGVFSDTSGETYALVGESGCGKSVSAMALMGWTPGRGRRFAGDVIWKGRKAQTRRSKNVESTARKVPWP